MTAIESGFDGNPSKSGFQARVSDAEQILAKVEDAILAHLEEWARVVTGTEAAAARLRNFFLKHTGLTWVGHGVANHLRSLDPQFVGFALAASGLTLDAACSLKSKVRRPFESYWDGLSETDRALLRAGFEGRLIEDDDFISNEINS